MTTIDSLTQEYKDIAALLDQKRTELAAPLRSTLFERMQRVLIEPLQTNPRSIIFADDPNSVFRVE